MNDLIAKIQTLQKEARDGMKRASGDSDPYLYQYMVGKFHAFGKVAGMLKKLPSKKEQKPARWSEEDERILQVCIKIVERWEEDYDIAYTPYSNALKSLRPSWKPSEEEEEPEYYQHFDPDC